jgi:nicotinate-nucleotide pyrophosphorylase (carboxylating)
MGDRSLGVRMFDSPLVRKLIDLAIEEDLALGDITASLTVPESHTSKAMVIARETLVVCGVGIVSEIAKAGQWTLTVNTKVTDGVIANDGDILVELAGSTRELLSAERTILNFLQRLCGVATYTRNFCETQKGLKILDTRKTMPGWRLLDKYATKIGGASNHRFSLGDMVLVKNNHIDAHPQGIRGALADVVAKKPLYMPWEVEVRNLDELQIALTFNPTIVMLDNFSDDILKEAVAIVKAVPQPPMIEVSGGVSKDRLATIHAAGVDAASVGALTTQAPNVDISMRII